MFLDACCTQHRIGVNATRVCRFGQQDYQLRVDRSKSFLCMIMSHQGRSINLDTVDSQMLNSLNYGGKARLLKVGEGENVWFGSLQRPQTQADRLART